MKNISIILFTLILHCSCTSFLEGQNINTIAGTGVYGYSGDDIPATSAKLDGAPRIAVDTCGNLYIGDAGNHRIRKVEALTGIIITVAGIGVAGYSGDGGQATDAEFYWPTCIAFDTRGNLYIGDGMNDRIRRVDAVTGIITTYIGNGSEGYSGDGGPATAAGGNFGDFAFDRADNMYVCDTGRVRMVTPGDTIYTVAGSGLRGTTIDSSIATNTALTTYPAIATDLMGNAYFVDATGSIYKIVVSTGKLYRVAGTGMGIGAYSGDGILATTCTMNPASVYVDSLGNIYSALYQNERVIMIDTFGYTHTVAGTGVSGFSGDGGLATAAKLWWPKDAVFDRFGHLYISDWENDRIREIDYSHMAASCSSEIVTTIDAKDQIILYPTPAYDLLNIDNVNTPTTYTLLSMVGAVMQRGALKEGSNSISVRGLRSGMYILSLSTATSKGEGERTVYKIIKE